MKMMMMVTMVLYRPASGFDQIVWRSPSSQYLAGRPDKDFGKGIGALLEGVQTEKSADCIVGNPKELIWFL